MRNRVLCAVASKGAVICEEDGRLVRVSAKWATPLVMQMSKSACDYALRGIAGRESHDVVISRRMATALQRFAEQATAADKSSA